MSAGADMTMGLQTARDRSRRWLVIFASSASVFSVLHHVDHVTRGNHSGWPFQAEVTPFTFILLGTAHFAPTGRQESPIHDIYMVYESPVAGMLALMILAGLMTSVALLATTAFVALRGRTGERAMSG